ncbi:MAG TPA: hypothetical protein PKK50_08030 [Myxococcota bacterium]|nr:hypothetical protein [Myxococcota bacterium]HNZ04077.1 hypothetical protein [Myxococcota bacterium]HOD08262.1 hypothetical protein [Myxococcota bacterium]
MNSGRMFAVLAAALVISSVAGGCKSGSVGTAPDFYVTPTGAVNGTNDRVLEGGVVEFTEGGGKITMVFGNVGDADLLITDIQIVSKNADMVVSPEPADITFPVTVVANDYKQTHPTVLKIDVHYQPDADRDLSATVIRVFTNDMNLDNSVEAGVFEFSLAPRERTAEIKVTPNNYIFIGATSSSPDSAVFSIENVGNAPLALSEIRIAPTSAAMTIVSSTVYGEPVAIHDNFMIDPTNAGTENGPVDVTIQYRPVTPPDITNLEVLWGSEIDTGVECSGTPVCQDSSVLCPDKTKPCPYSCFNGKCGCLRSQDCWNYYCDGSADCQYRCLTGVCRVPESTLVPLRGEAEAGSLAITYGDQADGCVNFTEITIPGNSCTKTLSLENAGPGAVILSRPTISVSGDENPYTVKWYKLGASQEGACGDVTGQEITEPRFTLTPENSPITVAVTYTAPSINGVGGDLIVPFSSPYDGQQIVRLCGGVRKGELAIAPAPEKVRMTLYAAPGSTAEKTVVVMNKGNLALDVTAIEVEPANVEDPEAFSILEEVASGYTLAEGEARHFTVSFTGDHDGGTTVNGFINVTYMDQLSAKEETVKINVAGFNSFDGVTLPTADAGDAASYVGLKVGDLVVLDGSASVEGTYDIPANSGYLWFVSEKPAASRVFLNQPGGPAQVTFIADVAGEYQFRLIVFSVDPESSQAYFSAEDTIDLTIHE